MNWEFVGGSPCVSMGRLDKQGFDSWDYGLQDSASPLVQLLCGALLGVRNSNEARFHGSSHTYSFKLRGFACGCFHSVYLSRYHLLTACCIVLKRHDSSKRAQKSLTETEVCIDSNSRIKSASQMLTVGFLLSLLVNMRRWESLA
jgi:hypothetical protein